MKPILAPLNLEEVKDFISTNIEEGFLTKNNEQLNNINLLNLLKRKNPYLYRAKGVKTPQDIIKDLVDAKVSSSEETLFGNFLENIAVFVCEKVHGGIKSGINGIDLEVQDMHRKYRWLISIKSGPNWANSSQKNKMLENFKAAKKTISTSGGAKDMKIECIEGCCYGNSSSVATGLHRKLCGQDFWHFISGDRSLYQSLIQPLGERSADIKQAFEQSKQNVIIRLSKEFYDHYVTPEAEIDWVKIVELNSGCDTR